MASDDGTADAETGKSKNTGPANTFRNSIISERSESSEQDVRDEENLDLEFMDGGEEGEDLDGGLSDFKSRLGRIRVRTPSPLPQMFDSSQYPPSYKEYEAKELQAIAYCKNFLKQYNHLFYTRRRLFLKPKNEFGIKKLVCSTIVPTQLPHCELLDWPNIADFVAGYLNYIKLRPPSELPETLHTPQTVLERMYGHCFEYSTVLCSMLIGAGYDAFVVSGFATREVCHRDLSYTICPVVEQDHIVFTTPLTKNICRYSIRPTRWLNSEYELRMLKKAQSARREEEENRRMVEERARELLEAPPPDELEGRRVHSWVMVLKGHRDVEETFFIEPSTGISHPTSNDQYLRIESLWNHFNYYVNMNETLPVSKLNLDIGDSRHWEYIFPGQDLHINLSPEEAREKRTQMALQGDICADELHLDVPMSWCLPLKITREDFDRKYPTGKRTRRYKYVVMEDFCRYLNPDGMVRKIYVYKNLACTDISYTICHYADRSDHLDNRFFHQQTGRIIEKFLHGRDDFLREHHYFAFKSEAETSRLMIFAEGKRTDELYRREEEPNYIRSYYKNRSDRKTFKEVKFGPEGRVLESPKILLPNPRPIEYIVETFARNPSVPANSDIAKVTFSLSTDEIEIDYHVDDSNIFGSSRHFSKPPNWWDDTQVLAWSPELHSCFEANYLTKPKGEFELYQMLISLMKMEAKTREMTRMTEKESRHILKVRNREEEKLELVRTYVQADRDQALREVRLKLKAQAKAARFLAKQDILRDYLEPFMHRVGLDEITNKKQAVRVKDDCLRDLKETLINQANMIKEQFMKETKVIENSQKIYHEQFTSLSAADIEDYKSYLLQHMFTAHILEQRLMNLKEYAPVKYQELYDRMLKDKRLEPFLI